MGLSNDQRHGRVNHRSCVALKIGLLMGRMQRTGWSAQELAPATNPHAFNKENNGCRDDVHLGGKTH